MAENKPLPINTPKQRRKVFTGAAYNLLQDADCLFRSYKVGVRDHPFYGRIDTSDFEGKYIDGQIKKLRALAKALQLIAREIQK